jgi:CelD/BcsL family acetyltransferase involved in cellulose biosynthesis
VPLTVEGVEALAAFEALRQEWNAAAAANVDPNVFLTWEWLATWWRYFGEPNANAELHVVTVRDEEGLVAAAPLFRKHWGYGPLRAPVLHQISYDAGDYGGVLLLRRHGEAVDALVDHLAQQVHQGVDGVVLSRLTTDSTFLAELRRAVPAHGAVTAQEAQLGDACPFADVREGYDLRRHLKKHKVRQRMRRLAEKHEVAYEGLDRLVEVHRQRWAEREDELQGLLADQHHEAFLLDAIRALDGGGWLRLLTLTADGRTVAAELDFELGRRVYMFKAAFDPAFGEFSPGQLLTYRVFEDGMEQGVQEFDFMRGDHPYKRRWTNDERHLVTVTLTRPGPRGRLALGKLRAARSLEARLG